jgi:hypothetical protein
MTVPDLVETPPSPKILHSFICQVFPTASYQPLTNNLLVNKTPFFCIP